MQHIIPPSIRIFISSTFADMENERHHFSTVIMPKLRKLCIKRGVSVFSVDLRWGITQEDQINGQVLPICLREIDRCRPFFIGILGNRYGSTVENINDELTLTFPWLKEEHGKSVTELEMLHGVLRGISEHEKVNCCFFMRDDKLSESFYACDEDDDKKEKLKQLKSIIKESDVPVYDYGSIASFEAYIIEIFTKWLDSEFPSKISAELARRNWFNNELLRNYMENEQMDNMLYRYCSEKNVPSLMISGEGERGKTTWLTHWQPKSGNKLLINCASDEQYRYWPNIAHEIIAEIKKTEPECLASLPSEYHPEENGKETEIYYAYENELTDFRKAFSAWLENLKPKQPFHIVINDLNLLNYGRDIYLNWLPSVLPENLYIICSSNNVQICSNAEMLGWNIKEMPLFSSETAGEFMDRHMEIFGKKLNASQKTAILQSKLMTYPGYLKFIVKYLNVYGRFDNLDDITSAVGKMEEPKEIYNYVLNSILAGYTPDVRQITHDTLFLLSNSSMALTEDECNALISEAHPEMSALAWSDVRRTLDQFAISEKDKWMIDDAALAEIPECSEDVQKLLHRLLAEYFEKKLQELGFTTDDTDMKECSAYSKAILHHYAEAEEWERLCENLKNPAIFVHLAALNWKSVRVAWMKLMFYSEIDIADKLVELCRDTMSTLPFIQPLILGLLRDLGQTEVYDELQKLLDIPAMSDFGDYGTSKEPQAITELHDSLAILQKEHRYHALYEQITEFLKEHEDELSPFMKCRFYSMLINAESELRLESALQSANKYYFFAIETTNPAEILRAVAARSRALFAAGYAKEAFGSSIYAERLAESEGSPAEYLSAVNLSGLCCCRMKYTSKALDCFDTAAHLWLRMGNHHEAIKVMVNRCDALYNANEPEAALKEAKMLYELVKDNSAPSSVRNVILILTSIGKYSKELGLIPEAETAYGDAINLSNDVDASLSHSAHLGLIEIYEKRYELDRAVKEYEVLLDILYKNHDYETLAERIKECKKLLQRSSYEYRAEKLMKKWEKIFAEIPGGTELLHSDTEDDDDEDSVRLSRLRARLLVARSEENWSDAGKITAQIAEQLNEGEHMERAKLFVSASELFSRCDDNENEEICRCCAMSEFTQSEAIDSPEYKEFKNSLNASDKQLLTIWYAMRIYREDKPKNEYTIEYPDLVRRALALIDKSVRAVSYCFDEQMSRIAQICDEELLLLILNTFLDTPYYTKLKDKMALVMTEDEVAIHSILIRDYSSSRASKLIAQLEKTISVLLGRVHSADIATIAGNLALIFRRRHDKEKTIYYHNLSMSLYREEGLLRDCLIETLNLATAHKELGSAEDAIKTLSDALDDTENSKAGDVYAAIAGNLAAHLIDSEEPEMYEERIKQCFEIEEGYFASVGSERELAISLVNQIKFYASDFDANEELIRRKYAQAYDIMQRNDLREFAAALGAIKMTLDRAEYRRTHKDEVQNAKELFNELMSECDTLELVEIQEDFDDHVYAVCKYKKDLEIILANIFVYITCDEGTELNATFALQPMMTGNPELASGMAQYALWWNEQGEYSIDFDRERLQLISTQLYGGYDWQTALKRFKRDATLWLFDVTSVSLISMGLNDMDEFRSLKLKLKMMNDDDDDSNEE